MERADQMQHMIKAIILFFGGLFFSQACFGEMPAFVTVSGAVNNPMTLTEKSLAQFARVNVQLNEITTDKKFNGAFVFHGVPLKSVLEVAHVEKSDTDFQKPVDLAVLVKNMAGQSVALSWGEIFFKNPGNVVIALSADPIFPHKGIDHFKDQKAYHDMMRTLNRTIGFPKLVVTGDFYTDRCIENVTEIIVYDLRPNVPGKKSPTVYSEKFTITGDVKNTKTLENLSGQARSAITAHVVGEGRGYHGTKAYTGTPLTALLDAVQPRLTLNTVFMASAPDAYRVLLSYGELFLTPLGKRVVVADTVDGKPFNNGGKHVLVLPDDLMADRELKAIANINVVHLGR